MDLAALSNVAQYTWWKGAERKGSHLHRYLPLYLVLASIPLIMADPTRHVLQDADIWRPPSSSMYIGGDCDPKGLKGFMCLSLVGWLFTIVFTYTGFGMLLAGVVIGAGVPGKVRKAWRDLRRAQRAHAGGAAVV